MKRVVTISAVLLFLLASSAIAKRVVYGSAEWSHCFPSRVVSFTLQKGAWRCESLAGIRAVDHSKTDSFQDPDCYRGATPIPAEGGTKAQYKGSETEYAKKIVSFCFAGEGLYARECDFGGGCE